MKAMTFHMEDDMHARLKTAVAFRKTTVRRALNEMVEGYVIQAEKMMKLKLEPIKKKKGE
ncbi:MAG TPA: hypothetical protein PLS62_11230 [Desulfobacteraceae bacterium]|nr:hypothetical protein [Desulfobacteraceae bacterium]